MRRLLPLIFATSLHAQSLAHAKHEYDARNWDAAKSEFAALARSTPNDVTPVMYLGKIALNQNDIDEGVKQFERCVQIDDKNADCHAWLGNAVGSAAQHASKFRLPFLAKRVKNEFERAVQLDPKNGEGRWGLLQYYMQAPGFLGGSMDRAREQAGEIEKLSKLRGAMAYAQIANKEKNAHDEESAWTRAIGAAPDSLIAYNGLVNFYVREKRWSDAFATLDRLAKALPSEPSTLISTGVVALVSGEQLARGEEALKRWIANPPADAQPYTHSSAHYRLGQLYEKTGRKELAKTEFQKAVSLNDKNDAAKKALDALR